MILTPVKEKDSCYGEWLRGVRPSSLAAEVPELSYLNVEMTRLRPGMSDFIIRASTPSAKGGESKIISIRGGRALMKYETCKKLSETFGQQFSKVGDTTIAWARLDVEHLTDMIYNTVKFFAANISVEKLQFSTEALSVSNGK